MSIFQIRVSRVVIVASAAFAFAVFNATLFAKELQISLISDTTPSNSKFSKASTLSGSLHELVVGDRISVNGMSDQQPSFVVESLSTFDSTGRSISAANNVGQKLLLNLKSSHVYGSISGHGSRYSISGSTNKGLRFVDQNHDQFPTIDLSKDMLVPPGLDPNMAGIDQMPIALKKSIKLRSAKSGVSTIRLLFVHSTEFGTGFASPSARINQLVSFTNSSLQRSGVDIEFTVAHIEELPFDNNATTSATLSSVTNGEGSFSGVAALRNVHSADMVAVLSFQEGFSANGVAWVNGSNPDFAFSSTRLSPNCCDSVFAHELGHNLGSGHELASVNPLASAPCDFNFTGYSCGHGNLSNGWGTIMSRINSGAVNDVFSNPALTCVGEPCGIADGQTNAADNFSSFNISRLLVASFRPDPPDVIPLSDVIISPIVSLLLDEE